jgi:hypothetical protein
MNLSHNLSQHRCNNWMLKVTNNVMDLNGIRRIAMAGPIVRNDEAVGSIPTSSTNVRLPLLLLREPHLSGILLSANELYGYSVWDFYER